MNRKGIILAGGNGTRLKPVTNYINKHLLPVYDKPMIYYPIKTLLDMGIEEILIICKEQDFLDFYKYLKNFNSSFAFQNEPKGIPEAYIIAESFLNGSPSVLILGDNIFLDKIENTNENCIFVKEVHDPKRFGVLDTESMTIEEKPENPKSNLAVTGLYLLDETAPLKAKNLKPSKRGELEITDLLNQYTDLKYSRISNWFDTGTFDSLLEAGNVIRGRQ